MPDIYRESIEGMGQEVSVENRPQEQELTPEPAEEKQSEYPAFPAQEEASKVEALKQAESAPLASDSFREGGLEDWEKVELKNLVDIALTKGVEEAIESAKKIAAQKNTPHILDVFHDYLSDPENQKKLGIENI